MGRRETVLSLAGLGAASDRVVARNYDDPAGPCFTDSYAADRRAADDLRVVTFNVKFSRRVDRAIEVLRTEPPLQNADVLVLQEMTEAAVDRIARALSLNYVYYPSAVHPRTGANFGNAVLSPWPIEESRKLILPHRSRVNGLQRAAVGATLSVAGERIRVYGVHLETAIGITRRERRAQAASIVEDARGFRGPVVVGGDFNNQGIGRFLEANGFVWATKGGRRTIAWFAWDHVFARGLRLRTPWSFGVVRHKRKASDHHPAWVSLVADPRGAQSATREARRWGDESI